MHLDVTALNGFYASPLGVTVRQIVTAEVRTLWPSAHAERVAALGHALPFLDPFLPEAERVVVMMPAAEGVAPWPRAAPNLAALAYEDQLPLPDNSIDKLIVVHLIESTRDPFAVMREAWRVLMPMGRMLTIVPYRNGAWARADHTPFGLGRPFSRFQLRELLNGALLTPRAEVRMLYVPPSGRRTVLAASAAWERMGRKVLPRFAGLLAIEAEKSVMGGVTAKRPSGLRIRVPALQPRPAAVGARSALTGAEETPPARPQGSRTTRACLATGVARDGRSRSLSRP